MVDVRPQAIRHDHDLGQEQAYFVSPEDRTGIAPASRPSLRSSRAGHGSPCNAPRSHSREPGPQNLIWTRGEAVCSRARLPRLTADSDSHATKATVIRREPVSQIAQAGRRNRRHRLRFRCWNRLMAETLMAVSQRGGQPDTPADRWRTPTVAA
jgi:hypothetical protein